MPHDATRSPGRGTALSHREARTTCGNFAERDRRAVEPRKEAVRRGMRLVRQQGDETVIRGDMAAMSLTPLAARRWK